MIALPNLAVLEPDIIHNIWKYDLINISGNNIKISNIIVALILLFLGLKFSKKITKFFIKILSKKLSQEADTLHTIERLISYFLFIITIFIALQIANIPLGIFAFIGGALAIGVGLGAQGIVTNFINTIVIMVEKPVKIGDIVEIQEITGRVKEIGTRCITIAGIDSEEVLIPNAILMQNKVAKWTPRGNKANFYIYVNVTKDAIPLDYDLILQNLNDAVQELDFIVNHSETKVYLTAIDKAKDQFCVCFVGNINKIRSPFDMRSKINFALLKHLKIEFNVEFSKNIGGSKKAPEQYVLKI